jgi:hypothetical protein
VSGYTTQDVARMIGVSAGRLRAYLRAGVLSPEKGTRGELRFREAFGGTWPVGIGSRSVLETEGGRLERAGERFEPELLIAVLPVERAAREQASALAGGRDRRES